MGNRREKASEPMELFSPLFGSPDRAAFQMRDGNKTYDVTMHFSGEGTQSVLQQFKELILSEALLPNRTFDNNEEAL